MKFLVDECLSPALVTVANEAGYEAYHVAHRGWSGLTDGDLLKRALDGDMVMVTNNRSDFLALVGEIELHPGLVVILENVRREAQVACFRSVLAATGGADSLINRVAEVDGEHKVRIYDLPKG